MRQTEICTRFIFSFVSLFGSLLDMFVVFVDLCTKAVYDLTHEWTDICNGFYKWLACWSSEGCVSLCGLISTHVYLVFTFHPPPTQICHSCMQGLDEILDSKNMANLSWESSQNKQAQKPRSYACSRLRPTDRPSDLMVQSEDLLA